MRKIDQEIWQDDFILSLSPIERLLWIGLIVTVADDQGRLENSTMAIKVKIFPIDRNVTQKQIEQIIKKFSKANKILIYSMSGKNIIQIKNWWRYQSGATWMNASLLPAPKKWQDFFHYTGKGRKIIESKNWDKNKRKSYSGPSSTSLANRKQVTSKSATSDNDNDNDNDNVEDEEGGPPHLPSSSPLTRKITDIFVDGDEKSITQKTKTGLTEKQRETISRALAKAKAEKTAKKRRP